MEHNCTICGKRVPKAHMQSHLRWHLKHQEKSKDAGITERAASFKLHKIQSEKWK